MEDSSKTVSDLRDVVSSLDERLTALETKVTKLCSTHEQGMRLIKNERLYYSCKHKALS